MENNVQKYFLGANSCEGFISKFDEDFKDGNALAYIIKGGPGTGKSSFMKYIASRASDLGERVSLCPCSSDPDSLDAVILEDRKIVLLDGTAPHVVEPKFPGAVEEIVNLGAFWNSESLISNREGIINATEKVSAIHKTARAYLKAAGEFLGDNLSLAKSALNRKKCERFAESICKTYITSGEGFGSERIRFISGTTPKGVVCYHKTLEDFYENLVIIEDKMGAAANEILEYVRKFALINGHDVITLKSAFLPSSITEHIIVPSLSLCVASENAYCRFESDRRRVHARRFYDVTLLNKSKGRIRFNRKMTDDLLVIAASTLYKAKAAHDELEKFYIESMDFKASAAFAGEFFAQKIAPYLA